MSVNKNLKKGGVMDVPNISNLRCVSCYVSGKKFKTGGVRMDISFLNVHYIYKCFNCCFKCRLTYIIEILAVKQAIYVRLRICESLVMWGAVLFHM